MALQESHAYLRESTGLLSLFSHRLWELWTSHLTVRSLTLIKQNVLDQFFNPSLMEYLSLVFYTLEVRNKGGGGIPGADPLVLRVWSGEGVEYIC